MNFKKIASIALSAATILSPLNVSAMHSALCPRTSKGEPSSEAQILDASEYLMKVEHAKVLGRRMNKVLKQIRYYKGDLQDLLYDGDQLESLRRAFYEISFDMRNLIGTVPADIDLSYSYFKCINEYMGKMLNKMRADDRSYNPRMRLECFLMKNFLDEAFKEIFKFDLIERPDMPYYVYDGLSGADSVTYTPLRGFINRYLTIGYIDAARGTFYDDLTHKIPVRSQNRLAIFRGLFSALFLGVTREHYNEVFHDLIHAFRYIRDPHAKEYDEDVSAPWLDPYAEA